MARVKKGMNAHKRHKKILKQARGFYGQKSKVFRAANPAVMRSLASAYVGRKQKKRDYRRLWIARINAGARLNGISYSRLMDGLISSSIARCCPRWPSMTRRGLRSFATPPRP